MSLVSVYRPNHITSLQSRRRFLRLSATLGSALALGGLPALLRGFYIAYQPMTKEAMDLIVPLGD